MTEGEAKKKIDGFMIVLNEVWEQFDDNFFDGLGLDKTLEKMETFIHRFREGIKERNGNGTDI